MKTKPLALLTLALLPSFFTPANADLKDGLVAHWSFDDCRATDNSGNGHDGTLGGNPQCVDGVKGKAFSFDGVDDYINAGNSPLFNVNNHTITTWIKSSSGGIIVGKVNPYVYETISLASNWYIYPTLHTAFATDYEVNHVIESVKTIADDKWHFVAMSYDGASVKFYIDEILDSSYPRTGTVRTNNNDLAIGRHGGAANGNDAFFNGLIDDLRIYNRALTEAEVMELYNGKTELTYTPQPDPTPIIGTMPDPKLEASGVCSVSQTAAMQVGGSGSSSSSSAAEVCSDAPSVFDLATFDPTKLPKVVNMNNATCRYVAPFYEKIWKAMDVKTAPSCGDVLRYYTWQNSTRADNYAASTYFSNQLNGVEADNTLFNDRMEQVDKTISAVFDAMLIYDLRKVIKNPEKVNIWKKKGILKSLAKKESIFLKNKETEIFKEALNKALEKTLLDTIAIEKGTGWLCGSLIEDSKVSKSCANEAKKISTCAKLVVFKGAKAKLDSTAILKDAAECIIGGVTSTIGMAGNWYDVGKVVGIKQKIYGYILINDYLDNYYKKAIKQSLNDDASLEKEVHALAEKGNLSYSWLDLDFDDYDVNFVVNGIQDSSLRNNITSSRNVQAAESARKLFSQYKPLQTILP
jgi:hypothetical protein